MVLGGGRKQHNPKVVVSHQARETVEVMMVCDVWKCWVGVMYSGTEFGVVIKPLGWWGW